MNLKVYLVLPVMLVLLILQVTVLPLLPVFGVVPQVMLLATVAWAILFGLREGIVWAFVAGIAVDLFSAAPLGLSALAMMAAVAVTVFVQRNLPELRMFTPVLLGALATLVFWLIYFLLVRLLMPPYLGGLPFLGIEALEQTSQVTGLSGAIAGGYGLSGPRLAYVIVSSLVHGLLILPFYWLFRALDRLFGPRPVEI